VFTTTLHTDTHKHTHTNTQHILAKRTIVSNEEKNNTQNVLSFLPV